MVTIKDLDSLDGGHFDALTHEVKQLTDDESEQERLLTNRIIKNFVSYCILKKIENQICDTSGKSTITREESENKNTVECTQLKKTSRSDKFDEEEEERKRPEKKKRKNPNKRVNFNELGLEPPPSLPVELMSYIHNLKGTATEPQLVIMKQLFDSDLTVNHNRFSIPLHQIRCDPFLTDEEEKVLDGKEKSMRVMLIDPLLNQVEMSLKKWKMNQTNLYCLSTNWNSVVKGNKNVLKVNAIMQLWTFRKDSKRWFALIKVRDGVEERDAEGRNVNIDSESISGRGSNMAPNPGSIISEQ